MNRIGWYPLLKSYENVNNIKHLLPSNPICFSVTYVMPRTILHCPEDYLRANKNFDKYKNGANSLFLDIFNEEVNSAVCLFTDGSCIALYQYARFAVTSYDCLIVEKFKTASFVSHCIETMAILSEISLKF